MTPAADVTLKDLLPSSPLHLETALDKQFGAQKSWEPVADQLVKTAEQRVRDVLDVRLLDIFVQAWGKSLDILQAIKETSADPTAVENVALLEHTITDTEHPELNIEFLGQKLPVIRLDLDLSADVTGASLEIRHGAITSVECGDVCVQMGLSYDGAKLLPDWNEGPFKVLGKIALV